MVHFSRDKVKGHRFYPLVMLFVFFFNALISQGQDYPTVKAKNGDGIYSILKRNGLSPTQYMSEFIELNKGKIGKNNSVFVGQTYRLPVAVANQAAVNDSVPEAKAAELVPNPAAGTTSPAKKGKMVVNPLYGKELENVFAIDQALAGAVFYLISGHGGPDPGAIGKLGDNLLCEDEYAYDVTLRLSRELEKHGAKVYMIIRDKNDGIRSQSILKPDHDEVCYPSKSIPRNQLARLRQRTDAVNDLYSTHKGQHQRLLIIHVDSRTKGENIDVFFYHDLRSNSGKKMASNLQQTFKEKYDYYQPNRGYHGTVSERNLYVLKNSYPTATFIELGNINHSRDQQRFMMENNRQAIANWLCDGLLKDYKNNPE